MTNYKLAYIEHIIQLLFHKIVYLPANALWCELLDFSDNLKECLKDSAEASKEEGLDHDQE